MNKKSRINPCVVLENSQPHGWKLEAKIVTTNGNALELKITQELNGSIEQSILLYCADLQNLSNFGKELATVADDLIKRQK